MEFGNQEKTYLKAGLEMPINKDIGTNTDKLFWFPRAGAQRYT
jgi:hypothetical protein